MKVTNLPLLRAVAEDSGLTQREIADRAGISPGTVGNLLAGIRSGCSGEVYTRLLVTLGLDVRPAFEPRISKTQRKAKAAA